MAGRRLLALRVRGGPVVHTRAKILRGREEEGEGPGEVTLGGKASRAGGEVDPEKGGDWQGTRW